MDQSLSACSASMHIFRLCRTDSNISNPLLSVVKNDAKCVTASGPQTTHAMPEVHAVNTLLTLHWTMMNSKHNTVALLQRHDHRPRLHPWTLFSHHEFAAS